LDRINERERITVTKAASKRKFLTPALAAVALVGGLAAGSAGFSRANAEDAAVNSDAAREMFHSWSCSACHALADADASGGVGPTLDNPKLTRELMIDRISNGQGAMPSFGGQISDEDIALLADYIVAANKPAE
jgi:mono/diheme cytochrome c family protein